MTEAMLKFKEKIRDECTIDGHHFFSFIQTSDCNEAFIFQDSQQKTNIVIAIVLLNLHHFKGLQAYLFNLKNKTLLIGLIKCKKT